MTRIPIDLDDERFPVWEWPALLERAAAGVHLLEPPRNDAVRPMPGDPPEVYKWTNYHTLFLGPRRLLHEKADEFVHQIRGQFDFDHNSPWFECRGMIADLIRSYFPEDGRGLGSLSVTPMRRSAPFRAEEDRRIEVTSDNAPGLKFLTRRVERGWDPKIRLGDWGGEFILHTAGLPFASSSGSKDIDNRWAKVLVTRRVRAPRFRLRPGQENYGETWLCRAVPGVDEGRLRRGQIPAAPPGCYQGNARRVRTTPIVTLGKIDITARQYEMLAVEIDAAAGGTFLSVRHGSMPLALLLLNASPVEHIAVCNAVRRLDK